MKNKLQLYTSYLFILFVTVIILSCSKDKNFKKPIQLKVSEVIGADSLGFARDLVICDSLLIIYDKSPLFSENQLRVYNLNTFKFIDSMGRVGLGPGEFKDGSALNNINSVSHGFTILDFASLKVLFYYINKLGSIEYSKSISLKQGRPYMPVVVNDTTIMSLAFELDNGRFAMYDTLGDLTEIFGEIPPGKKKNDPGYVQYQAHKGLMRMTPNGEKLVISSQFTDLLEVYNIDGTLFKRIIGQLNFLPQYKIAGQNSYPYPAFNLDKCKFGYIDIAVTNSFIFALYSGQSMRKQKYEGEYLHVFSIDGELVKNYKLTNKMSKIAFDRKNNRLFGIHFHPITKIYRFNENFNFYSN